MVAASRSQLFAIRADGNAGNEISVPRECSELRGHFGIADIPQDDGLVIASRSQLIAIRAESNAANNISVL